VQNSGNRLISEMEDKELKVADYKYDWLHKASNLFFWIKQILLVIGVIYFIICIFSLAYPG
jgi:hypothetical protein